MDWITEFLNSEKTLYLFAGIIGIASLLAGLLFILFSDHKSFAITMIVIGVLEMAVMLPTYSKYEQKNKDKVSFYKTNRTSFLKVESISTEKALKSFFWLKLTYGVLILILIWAMSFLSP